MKLTYEDCKELKDVGFPQNFPIGCNFYWQDTKEEETYNPVNCNQITPDGAVLIPTLSELIEACATMCFKDKKAFRVFELRGEGKWVASLQDYTDHTYIWYESKSPEQAVKNLYIELNKKVEVDNGTTTVNVSKVFKSDYNGNIGEEVIIKKQ